MSDKFDPALDEFVYDQTEYDWDADAWLGQGEDLDTDALNELQCALVGARSRELDRIISGQTTDKSRADRIQAAIDRLPRIEDGDRELVEQALEEYRERVMDKFKVKPEREDTITMELMGIVTHMERLADDAERLLRSLPEGVLPWNWSAGLGQMNEGIAWLDDLTEAVARTEAGEQPPDID